MKVANLKDSGAACTVALCEERGSFPTPREFDIAFCEGHETYWEARMGNTGSDGLYWAPVSRVPSRVLYLLAEIENS